MDHPDVAAMERTGQTPAQRREAVYDTDEEFDPVIEVVRLEIRRETTRGEYYNQSRSDLRTYLEKQLKDWDVDLHYCWMEEA